MELKINSKLYGIKTVLIDDEDYERIKNYHWNVFKHAKSTKKEVFYVRATKNYTNNTKRYLMHRLLLNCPSDKVVDHINHDTLDNRKENLRICSQQENCYNSTTERDRKNKSRYKGVYSKKTTIESITYFSSIRAKGIIYKLGEFNNPIDAAVAYNQAALKYHGIFANLNTISEYEI